MTRHGRKDPGWREVRTRKERMAGEINFELKYPRWICFFVSVCLLFLTLCRLYGMSLRALNAFHVIDTKGQTQKNTVSFLMARHWWLSSNKLLKMKYFSRDTNDGNWKRHLIPRISKEFIRMEFQFIRTWYTEIFQIKELREKVIKLLHEEWLKIDKNIFVRNIRCFPTSIFQYSRRQFANISP